MNGKCKTIKQNYKTPRNSIGENLDSLDKDVVLSMRHWKEWEDKPQTGKKYL